MAGRDKNYPGSSERTHAGVYYLRSDGRNFDSILAALKINLKVNPTYLIIEELVTLETEK